MWSNLLWCQPSLVSIELWCLPARLWRMMSSLSTISIIQILDTRCILENPPKERERCTLMLLFSPAECESPQCWTFPPPADFLHVCGEKIQFLCNPSLCVEYKQHLWAIASEWTDSKQVEFALKYFLKTVYAFGWIWETLTSQLCWEPLPTRGEYSLLKRKLL